MGTDAPTDDATFRRAAVVNVASQLARGLNPLLIVFVARAYGTEALGYHAASQAVAIIAGRFGIFGIDRSIAYYVPRADAAGAPSGVRGALARTTRSAALAMGVALLYAFTRPTDDARLVALTNACSVIPFAWLEVLLATLVGRKRIDYSMAIRDVVWTTSSVVLALVLHHGLGLGAIGLPLANLLGLALGLLAAYAAIRKIFGRYALTRSGDLPPDVHRMAYVLGASDVVGTGMNRIDAPLLSLVLSPAHVGVWAVITHFVNTLRSIRGGFEGLTTAVISGIDATERGGTFKERMRTAFTSASVMLFLTQAPVCAAVILFGDELLSLFGPDFVLGSRAAGLACLAVAVHGCLALSGSVLVGLGRGRDVLVTGAFALTLHIVGLLVLPHYFGLVGAAAALGMTSLVHGGVMTLLMARRLTIVPYDGRMPRAVAIVGGSVIAALAILNGAPDRSSWVVRVVALAAFAAGCIVAARMGASEAPVATGGHDVA
jgi:O-antigen/teichoic acid export membrane protein